MVFGVSEVAGGHGPEIVGNPDIRSGGGFEVAPLHQADGGIGDRFSGQSMGRTRIEAEHIAGQMERTDLASPVVEELVGTNRATDDLIDVLRRLAFAINLLLLAVGEFRCDHAQTAGDDAELVGRRRNLGTRGGEHFDCGGCRGGYLPFKRGGLAQAADRRSTLRIAARA